MLLVFRMGKKRIYFKGLWTWDSTPNLDSGLLLETLGEFWGLGS